MIRALNLQLDNFMSYQHLDINLDNQGLVFIKGENLEGASANSNGSGKSAFIDGICWVLFDETIRGISKDAVVNNKIKKDCKGEMSLIVNGSNVVIRRYRAHTKFGDSLYLEVDGVDATGTDGKETQAKIEKLINMRFDLFVNSFLFGQGVLKYFAELTDTEQKRVLETILDLSSLEKYLLTARKKLKDLEASRSSLVSELSIIDSKLAQNKITLDLNLSQQSTWLTSKENNILEYQTALGNIDTKPSEDLIKEVDGAIAILEGQKQTITTNNNVKKDSLDVLYRSLLQRESDVRTTIAQTKAQISSIDTKVTHTLLELYALAEAQVKDIDAIKAKQDENAAQEETTRDEVRQLIVDKAMALKSISSVEEIIKNLTSLDASAACPTCGQPLDPTHMEAELSKARSSIVEDNKRLDKIGKKIGDLDSKLRDLSIERTKLKAALEAKRDDTYASTSIDALNLKGEKEKVLQEVEASLVESTKELDSTLAELNTTQE